MTNRKKMALAGLLVLVMVVSVVMGTLAYLTDTQSLGNTFLVGVFTPPDGPKPDPDNPDPDDPDPVPGDPTILGNPEGFIYEPYWNANGNNNYKDSTGKVVADNHRLQAGKTTVKDPYIGIGPKSESGYVLVCITNPMKDNVGFTLSNGWKPVDGCVTTFTDDGLTGTYYSEGLFAWVGVDGSDNTNDTLEAGYPKLAALNPDSDGDGTGDSDAWTTHPVFTNVYTAKEGMTALRGITTDAGRTMTVHAYIHQTVGTDDSGNAGTTATSQVVIEAAKTWATTECGYTVPGAGA